MVDDSSVLYSEFHHISIGYLNKLLDSKSVSTELVEKLLLYWETRLSDQSDRLYFEYFEYYLFFEFINAGIIASVIFTADKLQILHRYGLLLDGEQDPLIDTVCRESVNSEAGEITYNYGNCSLNLIFSKVEFHGAQHIIAALLPKNLSVDSRIKRLLNVFVRFYIPDSLKPENRFHNYFTLVNKQIISYVNPLLQKGQPVTFTHFKFEEFQNYVAIAGESFAAELITGLAYELTSGLKNTDRCYILNPREFLVVSGNCEKEIMEKRYRKMIFQVKSLIINYKVRYSTWKQPIEDLSKKWKDIAVMNY